jgi:hypothetical protein
MLWTIGSPTAIDLHPSGWAYSGASGTSLGNQVGNAWSADGSASHAIVWSGSAASAIDITPPGYNAGVSAISGTDVGGAMVSLSNPYGYGVAALWHGFNNAPINMSPAPGDPTVGSGIFCLSGNQQGGYVYYSSTNLQHAVIWSGTPGSMVDLNPDASIVNSYVQGTNGTQQCGTAQINGYAHQQCGTAQINGYAHAAVWSGSASSFVDLQTFLPSNVLYSNAYAIDADGNICGYATFTDPVTGYYAGHAVMWKYTPVTNHISVFQQPINDPATPESSFKKGSTIPVKFRLTDANGNPVSGANARISVTLLGSTEVPVNESDYLAPADSGSNFRDAGNGDYVYNLSTKSLQAGARYRIIATVGTAAHSVVLSLR